MPNVLHLLRKNTQLRASFISNQISHHIDYEPFIVYVESHNKLNDGGFAKFDFGNKNCLYLNKEVNGVKKMKYKIFKRVPKSAIYKIEKFIKEYNIEVLHFHYGTDCGIYDNLFSRIKTPSVVSFYGYDSSSFPNLFLGYGKLYLKNRVFRNVSKVLAMSPDMRKDLIKAGCPENKIVVHYYGTDTQLFKQKREYNDNPKITLLILASLVPKKGHLFLLSSLKKVIFNGITNFKLKIVGTGELEESLKKFVKANSLSAYVEFTGVIGYGTEEMFAEFRNADIFIHPSVIAPDGDKEGIPGTIIEAMASGLPVISTFHAGIPYVVENNVTGLLVNENDSRALTEAIESLIMSKEKREQLGIAGQAYALSKLDLREKERELEQIYSGLLS